MFKQLAGLLANNTAVTLMLTGTPEKMTVTVIPKAAKAAQGQEALSTPLVLTGSAEELDEGFADLVLNFSDKRKSLAEQFETTAAVLDAAKKSSAENAAKGISKTAKAAAGASKAESGKNGEDHNDDDDNLGEGGSNPVEPVTSATAPSTNLFEMD